MSSTTITTTKVASSTTVTPKSVYQADGPPLLEQRFADLKREIIKPENERVVSESYERLKIALAEEAANIAGKQQAAVPEIPWADVVANGGKIPDDIAEQARHTGCLIFRGLLPAEQALSWKQELKDYTKKHPEVRGRPLSDPTTWLLYWTKPQMEARSHPEILTAMDATSQLWHIDDDTLPIDRSSQIAYCDRFRIRKAGDKAYSLKAHLDSSSTERWEDPEYRSCYQEIFDGKWEEYDPWKMDRRGEAKVDMYRGVGSCSGFRSFQGWLSMSECGPGEGTLRVMPSLKLSTAYILLRPFFQNEKLDVTQPTFPGSIPARGQIYANPKYHPHLDHDRSIISIPKVNPGDFIYWHADTLHEVEDENKGVNDSSVLYVANIPLCKYNIQNMLNHRKAFREAGPPPDYVRDFGGPYQLEAEHEDHGAREENILTTRGRQALGLEEFDENEVGITEGQRLIRKMANEAMRE
ncbi:hypothetical protein LTR72_002109 [Exophiala xenobiotica]|nr:hypothetical protein LTR72_002109 [Exophiala xenobiotica]KAK5302339.1 hypothetical protein LTR14_000588 [Exophiala xenobiotica]KAK5480475.1 hypothetical protein LTR55_006978 [Exophiala xenobiotica]